MLLFRFFSLKKEKFRVHELFIEQSLTQSAEQYDRIIFAEWLSKCPKNGNCMLLNAYRSALFANVEFKNKKKVPKTIIKNNKKSPPGSINE